MLYKALVGNQQFITEEKVRLLSCTEAKYSIHFLKNT